MTRTLFTLILFFTLGIISAQFNQGQIIYESKVNMHRTLPENRMHMKDRIPEFRTSQHILEFTQTASNFYRKKVESAENEDFRSNRRRRWMSRMGGGNEDVKLFTDLSAMESLESREFLGKKFLISGKPNDFKWKFTGKTKQVGSYLCQQAVHKDSTDLVEVWFTPMIPVAAGPANYTGLPGLILHVDINEGERIITAMEVNALEIDAESMKKPDEGESITREEYQVMVREKMEEMRLERGGSDRPPRSRG
ncbi:MAG: GLPGLI family protein [Saprospiraceae bacterium]|nr:GLPGLI family protein [Saprospiraceae bacterium]